MDFHGDQTTSQPNASSVTLSQSKWPNCCAVDSTCQVLSDTVMTVSLRPLQYLCF